MIRVSIELPDLFQYRLKPVIDLRSRFYESGFLVGWNLPTPDLRVIHQNLVVEELDRSPTKRLNTPTIVDERVDGAQVINNAQVRSALAHPDVKFWLKRNTFRDYRLNNTEFLTGRYHYRLLNDIPAFHIDAPLEPCVMPITAAMANKIRLLPTAIVDRFAVFRDRTIDWRERRPIEVSFAGLVDYEIRGGDFWDSKFAEAQAVPTTNNEALVNSHRRAAMLQLTRLRHLRVLIGTNRALEPDIYAKTLLRSSISVSPWGFGEYAYRDYESILSGCILIKPDTDFVETFAPDIYQSEKYYVRCRPDFSDLSECIEGIMSDRSRAIEVAQRAREAMLTANSAERVFAYYLDLFRQALGLDTSEKSSEMVARRASKLTLQVGSAIPVRAQLVAAPPARLPLGIEKGVALTEDATPNNSHDIRLLAPHPVAAGLYKVQIVARARGRGRITVQLHRDWKDPLSVGIDLEKAMITSTEMAGDLFKLVYGPEIQGRDDGWVSVAIAIELKDLVYSGLCLVLYAADEAGSIYYDGDGRVAVEIGLLEFGRIDMLGIPVREGQVG